LYAGTTLAFIGWLVFGGYHMAHDVDPFNVALDLDGGDYFGPNVAKYYTVRPPDDGIDCARNVITELTPDCP
jgi:hypothetical protein